MTGAGPDITIGDWHPAPIPRQVRFENLRPREWSDAVDSTLPVSWPFIVVGVLGVVGILGDGPAAEARFCIGRRMVTLGRPGALVAVGPIAVQAHLASKLELRLLVARPMPAVTIELDVLLLRRPK